MKHLALSIICSTIPTIMHAANSLPNMYQALARLHESPPLPQQCKDPKDIQQMYQKAYDYDSESNLLKLLQESGVQPTTSIRFTNWKQFGHQPTPNQIENDRTRIQCFSMLLAYNFPEYAPGSNYREEHPWGLLTPEGNNTYNNTIIHQALLYIATHPYKPTAAQEESFVQLVEQSYTYHKQPSPYLRQLLIPTKRYLICTKPGIAVRESTQNSYCDDLPTTFETALRNNPKKDDIAKYFLERGADPTSRGDAAGGYHTLSADESIMNAAQSYYPACGPNPVPLPDDSLTALAYLRAYHKYGLSVSWERLTSEQQEIVLTRALHILVICPHHWTIHQQQSAESIMQALPNITNDTQILPEALTSCDYDRAVFLLQHTQTTPTPEIVTGCTKTLLKKICDDKKTQKPTHASIAMLAVLAKHFPNNLALTNVQITEQEKQLLTQFTKDYTREHYV